LKIEEDDHPAPIPLFFAREGVRGCPPVKPGDREKGGGKSCANWISDYKKYIAFANIYIL